MEGYRHTVVNAGLHSPYLHGFSDSGLSPGCTQWEVIEGFSYSFGFRSSKEKPHNFEINLCLTYFSHFFSFLVAACTGEQQSKFSALVRLFCVSCLPGPCSCMPSLCSCMLSWQTWFYASWDSHPLLAIPRSLWGNANVRGNVCGWPQWLLCFGLLGREISYVFKAGYGTCQRGHAKEKDQLWAKEW